MAVFAASWLTDRQPSHKKSLRFLLGLLESFKEKVRLAQILLQDIDAEFPELQNLLGAQDWSSIAVQSTVLQPASSEPAFDLARYDAHNDSAHISDIFLWGCKFLEHR